MPVTPSPSAGTRAAGARRANPGDGFQLQRFFPYRINILANAVSQALAQLYVQRFRLTRSEWRVLATLGTGATATAKTIARDTMLEKMQVSRAVARLERNGYVAREQDEHDRRNNIVTLTSRGRTLFRKLTPLALARENYILSVLSSDERATLDTIIDKLVGQAHKLQEKG